ncbi:MAG: ABC transporter ATP-binding protein [Spirochaetaceae bacterium]|jgi:NitT/TauT family transport system ATP-binding protein/taurine transport system ATP-binding protein|nr:ABC transporter ATP-binding protein [Spirochaetaceae bacterium]
MSNEFEGRLNGYSGGVRDAVPSVELRNVRLVYRNSGKPAYILQDINLSLYSDDFVCVLGPSGCGKTSLLNVLAGYGAAEGDVLVEGKQHNKPNPDVGVVFQQPNLFPWLSVEKNIEFSLSLKRMPAAERKKISDKLFRMVDLEHARKLLPHQISGGMKQRAAIAMTLASDSKIVLFDEPFSGLDALTREAMQKHLLTIWKSAKKCFFFITHDVEEALLISNRIIIMHGGPGRIAGDFINPFRTPVEEFNNFNEVRSSKDFIPLRAMLIDYIQGITGL